MGMFDTVLVPCPRCGAKAVFQSKGAKNPGLDVFDLGPAVPVDVMRDVNRHAPQTCACGTTFAVDDVRRVVIEVSPIPDDMHYARSYYHTPEERERRQAHWRSAIERMKQGGDVQLPGLE